MYSFQEQHATVCGIKTSEQMPQALSQQTGHRTEQVFPRTTSFKSLGFEVHEQLEEKQSVPTTLPGHCILNRDISSPSQE